MDNVRAAELTGILVRQYPTARPIMVARAIVSAIKLANYVKRRAELECNYPMTDENITRAARRMERAAIKVNAELAAACVRDMDNAGDMRPPVCGFGGDPCGPCGWVKVPGLPGDGWASEAGFPLY